MLADFQQQAKFLSEQRVVVVQVQTEKRKRFDKGTTASNYLGSSS